LFLQISGGGALWFGKSDDHNFVTTVRLKAQDSSLRSKWQVFIELVG